MPDSFLLIKGAQNDHAVTTQFVSAVDGIQKGSQCRYVLFKPFLCMNERNSRGVNTNYYTMCTGRNDHHSHPLTRLKESTLPLSTVMRSNKYKETCKQSQRREYKYT